MFGVRKREGGSLLSYLSMKIANQHKLALCDSGATASLMDLALIKRLKLSSQVKKGSSYELTGAFNGNSIEPYGEIELPFYINKRKFTHNFIVADLAGNNKILLGADF